MKTALLLSGQPRSVAETAPFIQKNIIVPNQPDVYIHMWDDFNLYGRQPVSSGGVVASNPIPVDIIDIVQTIYNPVAMISEQPMLFDERNYNNNKYPQIKPRNSLSQRYSVLRAYELMNARQTALKFQYDRIIRMRFDWAIQSIIDVTTLPENMLTVPNDCPHSGGYNDQFAVGNNYLMQQYSKLYYHIPQLYDSGTPFCDEILLGQFCKNEGIQVNSIHIPYYLQRATHNAGANVSSDVV